MYISSNLNTSACVHIDNSDMATCMIIIASIQPRTVIIECILYKKASTGNGYL